MMFRTWIAILIGATIGDFAPCPSGRRNVLLSRRIVERDWRLRWALGRKQDLAFKQEKQAGEACGSTAKFCCHDTPGRCRARGMPTKHEAAQVQEL
jgi:hypothetical protein